MYEYQIERILTSELGSKFIGVFARDKLPLTRQNGAYVINFDKDSQPGSHWVAVYVNGMNIEYFDSFGRKPYHYDIKQFLGSNYSYNSVSLQPVLSKCCGFFCVYFLVKRQWLSANQIISLLARSDSLFIVKNFVFKTYKWLFV
jgi:hypothetical protein